MNWPDLPSDSSQREDLQKILFQSKVDLALEQAKKEITAQLADEDAERQLHKVIHDARVELAKSAVDRSRSAAESVRNVAAAIGTVYTGIAGLSFAATDSRFPAVGIIPGIFLGIALVMSAAYAAWIDKPRTTRAPIPHTNFAIHQENRLNTFVEWAGKPAGRRSYTLKVAVLSLGAAVVLLPLPFVNLSRVAPVAPWLACMAVVAAIFALPLAWRTKD